MGSDQSSPKDEYKRNVSKAEVERALEKQRVIYEQRMQEMLKKQAATNKTQQNSSAASEAGTSTVQVPPVRSAPPPRTKLHDIAVEATSLERQRNPYSYTQNNLTEAAITSLVNNSRLLYPNLENNGNSPLSYGGNNNYNLRQSPASPNYNNQSRNPGSSANNNDFVFVNSPRPKLPSEFTPSAPPAPSSPPRRQRSVSRPRSSPQTEINCPTCKNRFGTKIFNCESGHANCTNCRLQQRHCGICFCRITEIRNISVEEVILQVKVPCDNVDEGCCLNFKVGEMENHLKECPFREQRCILPGGLCLWKGKLSLLATHFENFHPNHKGDVDTELFLPVHDMSDCKRMQLIKIGNFNFVFHLRATRDYIYIAVQLLGTKVSAAKWNYEIHVYDKGAPRRKYTYTDKCFSNSEPLNDLEKGGKCAVIPMQYAKTYINNGAIAYKFFIKKDYEQVEAKRDVSGNRRGRGRGRFRRL